MQIREIHYSVFPAPETPRPILLGCKKMSIFRETKKEKIYVSDMSDTVFQAV